MLVLLPIPMQAPSPIPMQARSPGPRNMLAEPARNRRSRPNQDARGWFVTGLARYLDDEAVGETYLDQRKTSWRFPGSTIGK